MQNELTRRRLIAVGGSAAATVSLAGCFEPGEGDEGEEEGDGGGEEDDERLADPAPGASPEH